MSRRSAVSCFGLLVRRRRRTSNHAHRPNQQTQPHRFNDTSASLPRARPIERGAILDLMSRRTAIFLLAAALFADSGAGLRWTPPANWKSEAQRPMRLATYTIPVRPLTPKTASAASTTSGRAKAAACRRIWIAGSANSPKSTVNLQNPQPRWKTGPCTASRSPLWMSLAPTPAWVGRWGSQVNPCLVTGCWARSSRDRKVRCSLSSPGPRKPWLKIRARSPRCWTRSALNSRGAFHFPAAAVCFANSVRNVCSRSST